MSAIDLVGYSAALLVLLTFLMTSIVRLRAVAIASNLAFVLYGALAGITPVLVLHLLLLPINIYRLVEVLDWPVWMRRETGGLMRLVTPRRRPS